MRALLIDPSSSTVTEIDIDGGYKSIQKAIGGCIELACTTAEHDIYVDEEGLLNNAGGRIGWFEVKGAHQPFAGRGVILKLDDEGDSAPATMTAAQAAGLITFLRMVRADER